MGKRTIKWGQPFKGFIRINLVMVALLVIINQAIIAFLNADLHALVDGEMLLYATPIAGFYLVSSLLTWRWSNHHWAVMAFLEIMFANGLNLIYITLIAILDNVDLLWGSFFLTVAMALLAIFITPTCYYFMRRSYKELES